MKVLLAAPCAAPRFEGPQLLAAARSLGLSADLFDHPVSRDPALELPGVPRRTRPDAVLIVAPEREEPATIDILRRAGARVALWIASAAEGAPPWLAARRAWCARAADAVAVTDAALAEGLLDRCGRRALHLPRAWHPPLFAAPAAAGRAPCGAADLVAVRGADDPLRVDRRGARGRIAGHGHPAAFAGFAYGGPVRAPAELAALLRGRVLVSGGRYGPGPPGVFDEAAAAAALGAAVIVAPYMGLVEEAAAPPAPAPLGAFAERLERLLKRIEDENDA
ncbi:MAG: hypothetical protein HY812_02340 [Planctomycetes bacterium]|nr:hypothetical protein [Planctomycetota bacterium]